MVRLANASDSIGWRNAANNANLLLTVDSSNNLTYNGNIITPSGAGPVTSITGTANQIIASAATGAVTLSAPQDIATSSSPTFVSETLTGLTASLPVKTNGSKLLVSGAIALASGEVSGILPVANGGTGLSSSPLTVPLGGTGNTTFTAYSVILAGTTATGAFQNAVGVGAVGQVLTSNGAGIIPSWQNAAGTGTVNSGTAGDIAYYATSANVVSTSGASTVRAGGLTADQSLSGTPVFVIAQNSSNTASSDAIIQPQVGGSGGGDPFIRFAIPAVQSWSMGLDNSNSDSFVLSLGTTLGGADRLVITTAGLATFSGQTVHNLGISIPGNTANATIDASQSLAANLNITQNNSSTNGSAASSIILGVTTAGADPYLQVGTTGANLYALGVDNSDSDIFKITTGASPSAGTTALFTTTAGNTAIRGVPDNTAATAGFVGEWIGAGPTTQSITIAGFTTIASITLTGGDWDISFVCSSSAAVSAVEINAGVATATNSNTGYANGDNSLFYPVSATFDGGSSMANYRVTLSGSTTYYLTAKAFGATVSTTGRISARRMR